MPKVLMFTTTILSQSTQEILNRLFDSLYNQSIDITMYLLVQNCDDNVELKTPNFVNLYRIKNTISLSCARNCLIKHYLCAKHSGFDLVIFPDDDCWYPHKNLTLIAEQFESKKMDFLVTKYRSENHSQFDINNLRAATLSWVAKNSSSITIFVSGLLFNSNSFFEEKLGVGATFNGGEDLDYAIRCYLTCKDGFIYDDFLIGHKDKTDHNKFRYYEGSLAVLDKHKYKNYFLFLLYIRKIFVGLSYLARGKITSAYYLKSLKIKL